mgnify:CR=1 FL=1
MRDKGANLVRFDKPDRNAATFKPAFRKFDNLARRLERVERFALKAHAVAADIDQILEPGTDLQGFIKSFFNIKYHFLYK